MYCLPYRPSLHVPNEKQKEHHYIETANRKDVSILYIPAVNIPRGAIKGDEVTLTLLPAAVAGGIKEYVVFYKSRNVKRVWEFKRTKQTHITLSPLQALTYYTVVVIGYTPNGETYGSQDLHFKTSNGM